MSLILVLQYPVSAGVNSELDIEGLGGSLKGSRAETERMYLSY